MQETKREHRRDLAHRLKWDIPRLERWEWSSLQEVSSHLKPHLSEIGAKSAIFELWSYRFGVSYAISPSGLRQIEAVYHLYQDRT